MTYTVKEVSSRKELKVFHQFQNRLYRDCPVYVPSLDGDQRRTLTCSPALDYCSQKLLLARDARGNVVGRCAAIINPRYNERYGTHRMRFGWMDYIDDVEVARALFDEAIAWGRSQGMTQIHGPMGYNTMYKQGMVVEGFDSMPQFNNLYNFDYYPRIVESLGFRKEADWVQYRFPADQGVPERLERMSRLLMERYNLRLADMDEIRKDPDIVDKFFKQYNGAFEQVRNFIPFTQKEIEEEGGNYINQLSNDLSCIVMDGDDEVAAFGICVPHISPALRKAGGSLFPFGWYHILKARRNYDTVDLMMVGVAPKWEQKGLSSIFHAYLARRFQERGVRYGITNPQFEDNPAVKVWDMYQGRELYIRRRCYIKDI